MLPSSCVMWVDVYSLIDPSVPSLLLTCPKLRRLSFASYVPVSPLNKSKYEVGFRRFPSSRFVS